MSTLTLLWLSVAALGITCLAALAARALGEFSPAELHEICRRRNKPERLGHVLRRRERVSPAMQSLRTVALAAAAATGGLAVWQQSQANGFTAGTWLPALVALLLAMLAANVWLPWSFARLWADQFLFTAWPLLWGLSVVLAPLSLAARVVDVGLHRVAGRDLPAPDEESFEEDIRTIVTEGHREGLLEEDAREMIEGVMELGDAEHLAGHDSADRHDFHSRLVLLGRDAPAGDQ